jgi:RNA-binding protein with serine-rich domain 1
VNKEHVIEIFSCYGEIKVVDFPKDRYHPQNGRGFCYVEYLNPDDAINAMKHMDGGQIDGTEVAVAPVQNPKPMQMMHRSPMRNRGPPHMMRNRWRNNNNNNNDMRRRRSPPFRRSSPRRR